MKSLLLVTLIATAFAAPTIHNAAADVTYVGFTRNGVEVFLGIPYAADTGGENRFKPPRPFSFPPKSIVNATQPGPACPQQLGQWNAPLTLLNVTKEDISEDCLNLNIVKPASAVNATALPVMVWIHGGEYEVILHELVPSFCTDSPIRLCYISIETGTNVNRFVLGRLEQ